MLLVPKFSSPFGAVCSCVFKFPNAFGAVCSLFLSCVVSFGLCAVFVTVPSPVRAVCSVLLKCSRLFRLVCSSFSLSPTVFARFARFSLTLVCFAWFVLSSHILVSLSSGLLRFLKFLRPCRTDCSAFCNCLVSFEWFAPCSKLLWVFRDSHSLVCFAQSMSIFPIERLAPWFQIF